MARPVGRPAKLTREQVARGAFDLVDAEGTSALTMPRLASELGVGTMTLYGYADSKDALVQMLPDLLLADLPVPEPGQPWAEMIETVYLAAFRRLVRHGHVTQLVAQSPAFGPAQAALVENVLACLEAQGFTPEAAFRLQRTAGTYTLGFAIFTITEMAAADRPRERSIDADAYPRSAEVAGMLAAPGDERQFLEGLQAIVAGISHR